MAKKKAPAKLTGGAGFRYEDHIAARFLLDLLGGTNSLGADFGRVTRVDWQARDAGWLADDLAVSCTVPGGDRAAGLSIKSDRQVTGTGFPETFVDIAWGQWLGEGTPRKLREGSDAVVLVTGRLAQETDEAWSKTLSEALQTTPERMVARLSSPVAGVAGEGAHASEVQRALFQSFRCPERMRGCGDTGDTATVRLLLHVRLLRFDYESPTSQDRVRALADCQRVLRSGDTAEAAVLWDRLIGLTAEKRAAGGSVDLADVLTGLRGAFDLCDHPDYRRDWEALDRRSREAMEDVRTAIADLPPLARDAERERIDSRLRDHGACLLVGESGSGKSALAREFSGRYGRAVWLTGDALDGDNLAHLERGLDVRHPLVQVLRAERAVTVLAELLKEARLRSAAAEALGRIGPRAQAAVPDLVQALKDEDKRFRWSAMGALVRIRGPEARAVVPLLIQALNSGEHRNYYNATLYLSALGPDAKDAIPELRKRNDDLAACALWSIDPKNGIQGYILTSLTTDRTCDQWFAASHFEMMGPWRKDAARAVVEALLDGRLPRLAPWAVERILRGEADVVVPVLVEGLKDKQPIRKSRAATFLGQIGRRAQAAVPALNEVLKDSDAKVRQAAVEALKQIMRNDSE